MFFRKCGCMRLFCICSFAAIIYFSGLRKMRLFLYYLLSKQSPSLRFFIYLTKWNCLNCFNFLMSLRNIIFRCVPCESLRRIETTIICNYKAPCIIKSQNRQQKNVGQENSKDATKRHVCNVVIITAYVSVKHANLTEEY